MLLIDSRDDNPIEQFCFNMEQVVLVAAWLQCTENGGLAGVDLIPETSL